MDRSCYLYLVFVILSCLFIAALWSPAWKGLTFWLLIVMLNCVFVTFPFGILGQVWYLIVSIPDPCRLSYFSLYTVLSINILFHTKHMCIYMGVKNFWPFIIIPTSENGAVHTLSL